MPGSICYVPVDLYCHKEIEGKNKMARRARTFQMGSFIFLRNDHYSTLRCAEGLGAILFDATFSKRVDNLIFMLFSLFLKIFTFFAIHKPGLKIVGGGGEITPYKIIFLMGWAGSMDNMTGQHK